MLVTTDPIKVVDRNTAARIINAVIMNSYVSHKGHKDWVYDAVDELKEDFNINVVPNSLRKVLGDLKKGKRDLRAASCFSGKISTRAEKDGMYREFDAIIDLELHGKRKDYVGLPANQIAYVARKYDSVVAVERDKKTCEFMRGLQRYFVPNEDLEIFCDDIMDVLMDRGIGERKFSIYDIDLMAHINTQNLLENLIRGIRLTAQDKAVICLVTCYGRKISKRAYEGLMPHALICGLEEGSDGWSVTYSKSGGYVDQIVPMKYEFLVIEK